VFKEAFGADLASPTLANPFSLSPHTTARTQATAQPSPAPVSATSRALVRRRWRHGLVVIWVAATLFTGIGAGQLIVASKVTSRVSPGIPVAQARIAVTELSAPTDLAVLSIANPLTPLTVVTSSESINQAQAGTPFQTTSLNTLQSAGSDLQPGFLPFGYAQGNIGTSPVN
jgi:hypothetical protein